jgi:hypothetical protein
MGKKWWEYIYIYIYIYIYMVDGCSLGGKMSMTGGRGAKLFGSPSSIQLRGGTVC